MLIFHTSKFGAVNSSLASAFLGAVIRLEKSLEKSRVLVTYYSKGGNTRLVAERVAKSLNADVDEIRKADEKDKAIFSVDPSEYDLVVVGTPVNGFSPSRPVADYLRRNSGKFRKLSTYLTYSLWPAGTLKRMSELASTNPVAIAVFKSRDIKLGHVDNALKAYITTLKSVSG
jgi:hypothetical protein